MTVFGARAVPVGLFLLFIAIGSIASAAPRESDTRRALGLFEQSEISYRAGRFAEAAELLREAYRLHPEPILLYDLGRALEANADPTAAIGAYTRYLDQERHVADRGAIERRIEILRKQIAEHEALTRQRTEAENARVETEARLRASLSRGVAVRRVNPAPWVTVGAGVIAIAVGAALGGLALTRQRDAMSAPIQVDSAASLQEARNFALGANIALPLGGTLAAAGVIWGAIDLHRFRVAASASAP